jgi:hypothetical protein
MREKRGESIVRTCEGEKRENEMFYNLIMHREFIGKHCRCPLMLVKFKASDVGSFL